MAEYVSKALSCQHTSSAGLSVPFPFPLPPFHSSTPLSQDENAAMAAMHTANCLKIRFFIA